MNRACVQLFLFCAIFLIGFFLRSPELIARNYLFGFDQGRDYLAAYSIARDHKLTLIGAEIGAGSAGFSGIFHGPGYFYLLALMEWLYDSDPYGGIVLMFSFGMAAMFLTFIVARKLFGLGGGLIAFYLVSMAPLIAPQSRFVWNHHLTSPFIVVYLYLVYTMGTPRFHLRVPFTVLLPSRMNPGLRQNDIFLAPLAIFIAGLLYHFELAISIPLIFSVFVILIIVVKEKRWQVYGLCMLAALLAYVPMIVFEMRHNFMALKGIITYLVHGGSHSYSLHIPSFLANARDTFVFEFGFIPPQFYDQTIQLFLGITVLSYFFSTNTILKRFIRSLFLIIATSMIVFLFLNNSVWNYYLIHLHFVYIFFFSFSFLTMATVVYSKRNYRFWLAGLSLLFLTFFLLSMAKGVARRIYMNIAVDLPDYGGKEKIAGKRAIIDHIYQDAGGTPFNVLVFTPPVYTYPYDYLFKTYAKQTYGYSPGNEKKGVTYLIIEIDGTKYWSWQGWLETVIKTGTVISHEYIPKPDLILEKRMFEE